MYGVTGHSDIYGVTPHGLAYFIECKTEDGVVSAPQIKFLEDVAANNGIAFVARSLDDVKIVMHEYL